MSSAAPGSEPPEERGAAPPSSPLPASPAAAAGPPTNAGGAPDATLESIAQVALRLLAGTVSRRTLDALKRTVVASPAEYPWQVVNQVVLGEATAPQDLAEKGLKAQRDWILRGGRETPGPTLATRWSVGAKTLVARLLAQLIFFTACCGLVLIVLLLLKHRWPAIDVYRVLGWLYETFPGLVPK